MPSSCDDATVQLEQCLAGVDPAVDSPSMCDASVVQVERLCPTGKADGFGDWLCSLGILRHCATPTCDEPMMDSPASCGEYIDADGCASCDYYLCREAEAESHACGDDGYFLAYGHRYCERLSLVTRPRLSAAGQRWVDSTRECLMRALEDVREEPLTCGELNRFAFDSHPGCYVDSGFCSLPFSDWWAVLMTVDPDDLELRQMLNTGIACIGF